MSDKKSHEGIISGIILAAMILGVVFVFTTIDVMDCPQCHGDPFLMRACPLCGHDGKVTFLQYFVYQINNR